jgi:hypothetical protein
MTLAPKLKSLWRSTQAGVARLNRLLAAAEGENDMIFQVRSVPRAAPRTEQTSPIADRRG